MFHEKCDQVGSENYPSSCLSRLWLGDLASRRHLPAHVKHPRGVIEISPLQAKQLAKAQPRKDGGAKQKRVVALRLLALPPLARRS